MTTLYDEICDEIDIAAAGRSAPAKINLALHVTGRRADGYHDLDTLAVFADLQERVRVEGADGLHLRVEGAFAACVPDDESNLVVAAARIFFSTEGIDDNALLSLTKTIPVGAGLGGGSADAAATLRAMNHYFNSRLGDRDLAELGAELGADIPMCVYGKALRARGIGDVIEPVPDMAPLPLVLVWPGRPVSTASVFKRLKNVSNDPLPDLPGDLTTPDAAVAWLAATRNDLQAVAIAAEPAIADALDALAATDQCLLARMSGSGSACFGIYPDMAAAGVAEGALRTDHPDWWIHATPAC